MKDPVEVDARTGRSVASEGCRPALKKGSRSIRAGRACCGCGACVCACPYGAVSMAETQEGFLLATVDRSLCRGCGACLRACPAEEEGKINGGKASCGVRLFAARNKDEEVRRRSASGGVFTCLAEHVLARGGVVYGAAWDSASLRVRHVSVETRDGLARLSGSKYVQSEIGRAYRDAKEMLRAGRDVLFSGTPCQNEGLRRYLAREYPNLTTVDVICHGVASPGVLARYLREIDPRHAPLEVSFRDKARGWRAFSFKVTDAVSRADILCETQGENVFLKGFLSNLLLRESCSKCRQEWKLKSDITLGDYWNISAVEPSFADDMGVSAVLVSTRKGAALWTSVSNDVTAVETPLVPFFKDNRCVLLPSVGHPRRHAFFEAFARSGTGVSELISHFTPWPRLAKTIWKMRRHWQKKRIAERAHEIARKDFA